ncbi:hypothetical protein GCM10007094_29470 [Pseudovibrio japonicus]|uniref:Secreted protein n=1 Tax=Pseudovibrio japonicus TaxID=366534 RepID=A0ABQ3EJR8_9HYPH|nr:hypothetical protein [Pseudovibrio japonicus]GHB38216.1 hypothetical protein GCM10007094_29470 [Pseudovibrio japonicus]
MKRTTATIAGLGILALVAYPAFANAQDSNADATPPAGGPATISFSDLSMADGSADDGTCATRYSNSYTAPQAGQSDQDQSQAQSDQDNDIVITETDGTVGAGIYTLSNTYAIVFPDSDNGDAVEVQMFASGLSGESPVTGVFSDGTCRGRISVEVDGSAS